MKLNKTKRKSNYEMYGDAADEIERLHEAMQEMRDRYSAKCARVEALEGVAHAGRCVLGLKGHDFPQLAWALHEYDNLAATEHEGET